uniref:Uncharacterized protein n=1 Tax=Setaria viridis TaxID=4556 RepID=A0A4U6VUF9_SETVI|nr:hypothetical protein SEVIR_2G176375v2 [Setaria viridis]
MGNCLRPCTSCCGCCPEKGTSCCPEKCPLCELHDLQLCNNCCTFNCSRGHAPHDPSLLPVDSTNGGDTKAIR